ncbi:MAG: TraB/GumN family protein [Bacteroidetes bacterium]|nr:TraB/GumN family protein [Bacteroidota bacterium]
MAQKTYQGLLWQISGNGLKSPSYLYGTMHVSNKVAFHLTDTFFMAVKNADIVALESNPQKWLREMEKIGLFKEYIPDIDVPSNGFYRYAFNFKSPTNEELGGLLAQDNNMVNPLLSRLTMGEEDYSESTYLDLFLYQAGAKQGKKIVHLEGYRQSFMLGLKAQVGDRKDETLEQVRYYKLSELRDKGKNPYEMMQDAYRRGNLNTIDSVTALTSSRRYKMIFIHKRNKIMAHRLDSLLRLSQEVFAGVGAAHLPGDSGMIELLRAKGYKLRPMNGNKVTFKHKLWRNVEEKFVPNPLDTFFTTNDSAFRVKVPGFMLEMPSGDGRNDYLYSDMANGAYYAITRLNTYAFLDNNDEGNMEKRIDSLFYENIPGNILKKSKLTKFGYTVYDIVNRTAANDMQRYQIYITPLEIIVFKAAGRGDFVKKMPQVEEFFGSILFLRQQSPANPLTPYRGPGFKVLMPTQRIAKGNAQYGALIGNYHILAEGYIPTGQQHYFMAKRSIHDMKYMENDEFELKQLVNELADERKWKVNSMELGQLEDGHPMVKAVYESDKSGIIYAMYIIAGPHYYALFARTPSPSQAESFFASFILTKPVYSSPFINYPDTSLKYVVKTLPQPGDVFRPLLERRYRNEYSNYQSSDRNKKYQSETNDRDMICVESDELVFFEYYKFNDFASAGDKEEHFKRLKNNILNEDFKGLYLNRFEEVPAEGCVKLSLDLADSFSHQRVAGIYVFKEGVSYSLKTKYSSIAGLSEFQKNFLETFEPNQGNKPIGIDIFKDKGFHFLHQLQLTDTAKQNHAFESLYSYVTFDDSDFEKLCNTIDSFAFTDKTYKYQAQMVEELGSLEEIADKVIPYLEKTFRESSEDRPDLQFSALQALADLDNKKALDVFKRLVISDPPLSQGDEILYIFYRLDDSLELSASLFPDLLNLLSFEEYRPRVLQLLATLVDSGLVSGDTYTAKLDVLIKETRYALKRQQSHDQSEVESNEYEDYFTSYYSPTRWTRHELSYLCAILLPFAHRPEVAPLLESMWKIKDNKLLLRLAIQHIKAGKNPPADVWERLSKEDKDLPVLFEELKKANRLDLLIAERKTQYLMAKGRLFEDGFDDPKDSIDFLTMRYYITDEGQHGHAYFFKHKEHDEKEWSMAVVAFSATDSLAVKAGYDYADTGISFYEKDKKGMKKKMDDLVKWFAIIEHKRVFEAGDSYYDSYYDY